MYYIGLLSGTSMDAVDGALVDFSKNNPALVEYRQWPIDKAVRDALISINKNTGVGDITKLDFTLGKLFARAALDLIKSNKIETNQVTAIGCHGQTILHRPEPPEPTTLQIADPNIIAQLTGIPTVADFRRMDMAAGGQGAPLAPIFHQHMFQHENEHRVVLNIGGMGNITILHAKNSKKAVTGFDTGPGNVLLDAWIDKNQHQSMDKGGAWAATGKVNRKLLDHLLEDEYFSLPVPKSTGRDYFNRTWLLGKLSSFKQSVNPEDVQATLVELTSTTISNDIRKYAPETKTVLVCGGGVHNKFLLQSLANNLPGIKVASTGNFGVNPDAVEAMTFALLAKYRLEELPGNIPSVTGANCPTILGAIYSPLKRS